MTNATNLKARTFSKKAKSEILAIVPTASKFTKSHISGMGYVYFIKDALGETVAKCYRATFDENGGHMKLMVG